MNSASDMDVVAMFFEIARKSKYLTREEETKLGQDLKLGGAANKRARDKLVTSHLRLAISVAKKFAYTQLPLEDLIQEGNIGLMQAVDKFDVDLGYRFGTYARWWVFQAVKQFAYERGHAIRIPESTNKLVRKMNVAIKELSVGERLPTDEEVAAHMGEEVEKVRKLSVYALKPISINLPVGFEDSGAEIGDFIADDTAVDAEQAVIDSNTAEIVQQSLDCLNDRERLVIVKRFDLDGEGMQTLEDLSQTLGVTRERVRQIEVKAKQKLSKASDGKLRNCL